MPIRPFLSGQTFEPETVRLMGVAFESTRAAVKRPGDLTDEIIAKKIIELANAGERNVDVFCEAALNVPTGAISASSPPPLPALFQCVWPPMMIGVMFVLEVAWIVFLVYSSIALVRLHF